MSRGSRQTSREDILAVTRKLFTESGYNNVSLREIAKELGISVGNLAYYYKSKVELIEAAILEKHEKYEQEGRHTPATSLEELDGLLRRSCEIQEEHLYYYRQYSQLSVVSGSLKELQIAVYRELEQLWRATLSNLRAEALMETGQPERETDLLISAVLFLFARWHERDTLDQVLGIATPNLRDVVWSLLFPLLTEKGREIYRTTITG